MLADKIKKQLIEAMKAKDSVKVSTLRLLSSNLQNLKIDKREDLTNEEVLDAIRVEVKKRKDAIDAFVSAGRNEQVEIEKKELEILQEFLPADLSEEEVEKMVENAIRELNASSLADMGKVMGHVMNQAKGRADGNEVRTIVESKLKN